jgi:hypothetical protein
MGDGAQRARIGELDDPLWHVSKDSFRKTSFQGTETFAPRPTSADFANSGG